MKKALGRGLSALIPDEGEEILNIDTARVLPNPDQPRKAFDEESIQALSQSIKEVGIIQPIIVNRTGNGTFTLVAGERRWRACVAGGIEKIPCIIRGKDKEGQQNSIEVSLIENIQREDLNPLETAMAFQMLIDTMGLTQEEVAQKVGKDRATVANYLRLLNLPQEIKAMLTQGRLSMGHARAIVSVEADAQRLEIANQVVANSLSVRQTEQLCSKGAPLKALKAPTPKDPHIESLEYELTRDIGARVRIAHKGQKGRIQIEYNSLDELNRLIDILRPIGG